ncbi:Asp23/Gls24 family envelope stress response protein [Streptomyces sp. NPDC002499]
MTAHTDPTDHGPGSEDERLACGRLLSQVWDIWERQAADPHPLTCPYCQEAVRDLDQLETAVRDLRDDSADPSATEVTSLTQRVMDVVRLELRPGRPLPLGEPDEDLWIMEAVAARSLRAAAESVPGVRAGSCRLLPAVEGGTVEGRGVEAGAVEAGAVEALVVEVRLDIHAPVDAFLPDLAELVRGRVREAADRELGMPTAAVDIRVTDLVDTPADSQEGRAR